MSLFTPSQLSTIKNRIQNNPESLVIICFCAAWCDTCREYETNFAQLAQEITQHTFVWVDIENNPELLGDEDVEDFPTIAIQNTNENLFYGVQLPYTNLLESLIENCAKQSATVVGGPPIIAKI